MIGTKYIPVTQEMVKDAFRKVKANRGSAGIDEESIDDFEKQLEDNLYKIWNRLASGSYFPPAVKEVEIPKKDGRMRKLGIPTVGDRVAQTVVKDYIEPRLEAIFSPYSYGYRPKRSAHQALEQVRRNCWDKDWVIDMDIKGFFDNIDHELLMLAVEKHVSEKWVKMYIRRWLEMPIEKKDGTIKYKDGKGTPQGGVISPLLANLFLHYVFDQWLKLNYPEIKFARYADDVIVHCSTESEAEVMLKAINERMNQCKLELHPEKTKIVYCKDGKRKGNYDNVQFNFLGYTFQPREAKSHRGIFISFCPAISITNVTKIKEVISKTKLHRATNASIEEIAKSLNPRIRGWLNYYGKYRKSDLGSIFYRLNKRLVRWVKNRYKSLNWNRAYEWIKRQIKLTSTLFVHWNAGFHGI